MAQKRSTKGKRFASVPGTIIKYILHLKRAKREEAKKKCMRARNARSRERRIRPLSSLLIRNDRGAQ